MTTEYALLTIASFVFFLIPYLSKRVPGMGILLSTLAGLITGYFAYSSDPDFAPWVIYVYVMLFAVGLLYGVLKIFTDATPDE